MLSKALSGQQGGAGGQAPPRYASGGLEDTAADIATAGQEERPADAKVRGWL